jgi:hypothetical protein
LPTHVCDVHFILFWHSPSLLQTCACPCVDDVLIVGQFAWHCVPAFAAPSSAKPQHTWPLGQSETPSHANDP